MTSLIDCPQDERGTLRFRLFGIPVRVLPWFWLTTLFTGASQDTTLVLIWIAVVFVSILLHELGHVLAYRAFGAKGEIYSALQLGRTCDTNTRQTRFNRSWSRPQGRWPDSVSPPAHCQLQRPWVVTSPSRSTLS